ncbi:hypothetical protein GW746_00595 [Candidatus Saccharibacteria bacterium]|nr:hypothetical protein [Candidatus Saccharibacteria bacterium]NCS82904.1 hypothetical protein [Candidatus Saccharibacteria bacterium]
MWAAVVILFVVSATLGVMLDSAHRSLKREGLLGDYVPHWMALIVSLILPALAVIMLAVAVRMMLEGAHVAFVYVLLSASALFDVFALMVLIDFRKEVSSWITPRA